MFRVKENNACLSPVFSLFEPQQVATLNPTYHLPYFTDFSGPGFSFVRCLSWILLFCLIIFVFVCVWQPLIHNSDGVLIRCSMASKLSWDRLDAVTISLLVTRWKVTIPIFEAVCWAILTSVTVLEQCRNKTNLWYEGLQQFVLVCFHFVAHLAYNCFKKGVFGANYC